MKFLCENEKYEYLDKFTSIANSKLSPFKEVINKEDLSKWSLELDEQNISFNDLFQFQVNVNKSNTFHFFFKKEALDKEALIKEVSSLKKLKVTDIDSAFNKVKNLTSVTSKFAPVLVIIIQKNDFSIDENACKDLFNDVLSFFIEPSSLQSEEEEDENKKFKWENPFPLLAKYKVSFGFNILAAFLATFTLGVAVYYSYLGKYVCIFFYILFLVGASLSLIIYKDTFKRNKFLCMRTIITLVTSAIGYGIGIGGYILFQNLVKEKANPAPKLIMVIGISLVIIVLIIILGYLWKKLLSRKKSKSK